MEKEIVRLRQRKLSDGKESLYLDIYLNGKRKYEYLRLYLVPEKTPHDKQKNKDTLLLAKSVQAKKLVEIQQGRFGFLDNTVKRVLITDCFGAFYNEWCEKHRSARRLYQAIFNKIKRMPDVYMHNIDVDWVRSFIRKQLDKGNISINSRIMYINQLSCFFNYAVKKRIIKDNPCKLIEKPAATHREREYLTIDEVKKVAANTNRRYSRLRAAFLFSCLTGFRHSDIVRIKWSMVHDDVTSCRIVLNMQKTGGLIYQDISKEARLLMGERKGEDDLVFKCVSSNRNANVALRSFMSECGIHKRITFHCARHTFALLLLDNSTDIYTVSKLLGHTDVKTTLIYAHILDKKKQEAVNSLPSIFD